MTVTEPFHLLSVAPIRAYRYKLDLC
jgi:hypothetical protein